MVRAKRSVRKFSDIPYVPFSNASEAWFWFVRCQMMRNAGARYSAGVGDVVRPCDPDDIYRAVMALHRDGSLGEKHLQVLEYYGVRDQVPNPTITVEQFDHRLWSVAMERLERYLAAKGVVVSHDRQTDQ